MGTGALPNGCRRKLLRNRWADLLFDRANDGAAKENMERVHALVRNIDDFRQAMEGTRARLWTAHKPLEFTDTEARFDTCPWAAGYLTHTKPGRHPYYEAGSVLHSGAFWVVGALAAPEPNIRCVLDLCAGKAAARPRIWRDISKSKGF